MIHDSFLKSFRETKSPFITNPYRFGGGAVGGWVELGRTTLGSAGDTLSVGSLPDKRYYMFLQNSLESSATIEATMRFNADTGSNYANRQSGNGGEAVYVNQSVLYNHAATPSNQYFTVGYVSNLAANEKLILSHLVDQSTAGAGTAPNRAECANKWINTSAAINAISTDNTGSGDYNTGTELVILGWDPADTHTTNFWEELASVTTGSAGDTLESGTISAKKYLWIQASYKNDGAADINALPRFNGDAGSNYSSRTSTNGAADSTRTSRTWVDLESGNQRARFANMFIINNASNEKLCIFNQMDYGASGASTAPNRIEGVAKWANTSDQITSIQWNQLDAGDYAAGAELRVWGSD
jgi:hypothetical protein